MPRPWIVTPHAPIRKLEENLWDVAGEVPGGVPIGRRMTIARRRDGRLVLFNAVPLAEEAMRELETFGEPAYLLAPNGYHRLDLHAFQVRYPKLRVLAPKGALTRVAERVERVDAISAMEADLDVTLAAVAGTADREAMMTVRSGDRVTLVFADLFFNLPHQKGVSGLVLRLLGSTAGPRVSRLYRLLAVKDAQAFRGGLERLAAQPGVSRLIVTHGAIVEQDAPALLRKLAG